MRANRLESVYEAGFWRFAGFLLTRVVASTITRVFSFTGYIVYTKYKAVKPCVKEFCRYNTRMAKAGRPPRDPAGQASRLFPIRLTDDERAQYEQAAKRSGLTVSAWIRDRLGRAAKREAKR